MKVTIEEHASIEPELILRCPDAHAPQIQALQKTCGCTGMLLGQKFEQDADTMRLNESLDAYQHSK